MEQEKTYKPEDRTFPEDDDKDHCEMTVHMPRC